jgi:archaellum component FlaC
MKNVIKMLKKRLGTINANIAVPRLKTSSSNAQKYRQNKLEKLIPELQQAIEILEKEAKVFSSNADVIKSVCEHEPAYKYGDSNGRNMCKKCGTIF